MSRIDRLEDAVNDLLEAKGRDRMPKYKGHSARWWFGVALVIAALGFICMAVELASARTIQDHCQLGLREVTSTCHESWLRSTLERHFEENE